jgi:hypothetical protein
MMLLTFKEAFSDMPKHFFERYIALVRQFGPVQVGPSKFKPTQ